MQQIKEWSLKFNEVLIDEAIVDLANRIESLCGECKETYRPCSYWDDE